MMALSRRNTLSFLSGALLAVTVSQGLMAGRALAAEVTMDHRVSRVPHDDKVFLPDPQYEFHEYDVGQQMKIYGGKAAYEFPQPLFSLGGGIYDKGPVGQAGYAFGRTNPTVNRFYLYGDWRAALAANDNGIPEQTRLATTVNLDMDWQLTGTERLHALMKPLEKDGRFTRYEISGDVDSQGELEFDTGFETLFFEGDLGNIAAGFSGGYSGTDMPFAIGLMPLLFQNGVWLDDAFTGLAFTLPHMNSKALDISNMDITFFAGFDKIDSALGNKDVDIYGVNAFIEANQGYWEIGYGYTRTDSPALDGQDYHNLTVAFTRRYFDRLSNSIRVVSNFGQKDSLLTKTADGTLLLIENSWITSQPSTLVPYCNLFYGDGRPQSLARAAAAGGILKNTGILFESDNLTGYPTLDASANDTAGGALGVEYLFDLRSQIVVEVAAVLTHGNDPARVAKGDQFGVGLRYQRALDYAWILRADAMVASRDKAADLSGVRVEIRRKF